VTDIDACRRLLTAPRQTSPNTGVAPRPGLTLILPCFNEAERLPDTLAALLAELPQGQGEVEVLVVDDGSTDETLAVGCAIATRDARVRVIHSRPNRGKGFGVRTGVLAARGELVVFTDADGSYGPGDIDRIVAALTAAPVAIGSRDAALVTGPLVRRLESLLFNRVIQTLLCLPFRDTQCGLKASAARLRCSCSVGPAWMASRSTPNSSSSPTDSTCRLWRSASEPRSGTGARSSWPSTPYGCFGTY
jgi:Glycosyl transferase family 2